MSQKVELGLTKEQEIMRKYGITKISGSQQLSQYSRHQTNQSMRSGFSQLSGVSGGSSMINKNGVGRD